MFVVLSVNIQWWYNVNSSKPTSNCVLTNICENFTDLAAIMTHACFKPRFVSLLLLLLFSIYIYDCCKLQVRRMYDITLFHYFSLSKIWNFTCNSKCEVTILKFIFIDFIFVYKQKVWNWLFVNRCINVYLLLIIDKNDDAKWTNLAMTLYDITCVSIYLLIVFKQRIFPDFLKES